MLLIKIIAYLTTAATIVIPACLTMVFTQTVRRSAQLARATKKEPVISIPARIVAKRGDFTGVIDDPRTQIGYYVTFETQDETRHEFFLFGREFGSLAPGDEGILTKQGTRFHAFQVQSAVRS